MTVPVTVSQFFAVAGQHPSSTALLFDFDGTLSPTVRDPAAARPAEGVLPLLTDLADRFATVGIISGRPLSFLQPLVPDTVVLSGQYGLETRLRGGEIVSPHADRWAARVLEAADVFTDLPDGVHVEAKGLSLTVHYRNAPDAEPVVRALAGDAVERTGLVLHDAKASIELRPAVEADKGSVLTELAGDAENVLYAGDDLGDLPAFTALRRLRTEGRHTMALASGGPELPGPVRDAADLVVSGPDALVGLLAELTR